MVVWNLPAELDDIILDHLHDDRAALAKCSLVRRAWTPTARYHNWRDLHLTCSEEELRGLEKALETSPEVVRLVRSVSLEQVKAETCQWYDLNVLHLALNILSRFPDISALTLDGLWFGVSKHTKPLAVVLPSVRRLIIHSCTFDTLDIDQIGRAFPSLSALHFDGVWWGRWGSDDPTPAVDKEVPTRLPHLQELYLGSCFSRDKIIEWLLTSSPRPFIETLRLPLVGAYDTRLRDLLVFLGSSLHHIELGSPSVSNSRSNASTGERRTVESCFDFSRNNELRSIQLGVPTYRDAQFISQWLIAVLSQLVSPLLHEVRFALYPILRGDASNAGTIISTFDWRNIARTLDRPQFNALRRVVFESGGAPGCITSSDAFAPLPQVLRKVIPEYFEKLGKRGVDIVFKPT